MEARLLKKSGEEQGFVREKGYINGLVESYQLDMRTHLQLEESEFCQLVNNQSSTQEVQFNHFSPGSIVVFR